MKELIERLEAATGPDRELDIRIAAHLGATMYQKPITEEQILEHGQTWTAYSDDWPEYTSSIDAALTLVPEEQKHWSLAKLEQVFIVRFPVLIEGDWIYSAGKFSRSKATPAIALCIAALKARANA